MHLAEVLASTEEGAVLAAPAEATPVQAPTPSGDVA